MLSSIRHLIRRPAALAGFRSVVLSRSFALSGSYARDPPTSSGIPFESIYTQPTDIGASISGLSDVGIELDNPVELVIPGSAIILGGRTLLWDVRPPGKGEGLTWPGWTEEAFRVFEVVGPRPGAFLLSPGAELLVVLTREAWVGS